MKVLLVDDRKDFGRELVGMSKQEGIRLDWATETEGARQALKDESYATVIMLDKLDDGLSAEILGGRETGLLGLTAGDTQDRIALLRKGFDDAMSSPHSLQEVLVRSKSVLGKLHGRTAPVVTVGHVRIEMGPRRVFIDGLQVPFSSSMWYILSTAARTPGVLVQGEEVVKASGAGRNARAVLYSVQWRLRAWGHGDVFHIVPPYDFILEDQGRPPHASKAADRVAHLKQYMRCRKEHVGPNDYAVLQNLIDYPDQVLK